MFGFFVARTVYATGVSLGGAVGNSGAGVGVCIGTGVDIGVGVASIVGVGVGSIMDSVGGANKLPESMSQAITAIIIKIIASPRIHHNSLVGFRQK